MSYRDNFTMILFCLDPFINEVCSYLQESRTVPNLNSQTV